MKSWIPSSPCPCSLALVYRLVVTNWHNEGGGSAVHEFSGAQRRAGRQGTLSVLSVGWHNGVPHEHAVCMCTAASAAGVVGFSRAQLAQRAGPGRSAGRVGAGAGGLVSAVLGLLVRLCRFVMGRGGQGGESSGTHSVQRRVPGHCTRHEIATSAPAQSGILPPCWHKRSAHPACCAWPGPCSRLQGRRAGRSRVPLLPCRAKAGAGEHTSSTTSAHTLPPRVALSRAALGPAA